MYQEKKKDYGPRRNEYIRVPKVQLIGAQGENLGIVETGKALILAQESGLDLVEVGPNVSPPVCKPSMCSKPLSKSFFSKSIQDLPRWVCLYNLSSSLVTIALSS